MTSDQAQSPLPTPGAPSVSVVIATFNRRDMVQEAIWSALEQTYLRVEVIVVDDGSDDGTREALQHFGSRIVYQYQANAGESAARQAGVEMAKGRYLAFLDSDDRWLPTKLEEQVALLQSNPDLAFVFCHARLIDRHGRPIPGRQLVADLPSRLSLERLLRENFVVSGSSLLLRRSSYEAVGGFDPNIRFGEDWDLCLRLITRFPFGCVPKALVEYRVYDRGLLQSRDDIAAMLREHLYIVDRFEANERYPATESWMRALVRARVSRYLYAAVSFYAYGADSEGHDCVDSAVGLARQAQLGPETLYDQLIEYAMTVSLDDEPQRALDVIRRAARAPAFGRDTYRELQGKLFDGLAWQARGRGRTRTAIRHRLRSITIDPNSSRLRHLGRLLVDTTTQWLRDHRGGLDTRAVTERAPWTLDLSLARDTAEQSR